MALNSPEAVSQEPAIPPSHWHPVLATPPRTAASLGSALQHNINQLNRSQTWQQNQQPKTRTNSRAAQGQGGCHRAGQQPLCSRASSQNRSQQQKGKLEQGQELSRAQSQSRIQQSGRLHQLAPCRGEEESGSALTPKTPPLASCASKQKSHPQVPPTSEVTVFQSAWVPPCPRSATAPYSQETLQGFGKGRELAV